MIKFFLYIKVWCFSSIRTAGGSGGVLELYLMIDYNNLNLYYLESEYFINLYYFTAKITKKIIVAYYGLRYV